MMSRTDSRARLRRCVPSTESLANQQRAMLIVNFQVQKLFPLLLFSPSFRHGPQLGSSQSLRLIVQQKWLTGVETSCLDLPQTRSQKDYLLLITHDLLSMKLYGFHIQGDITIEEANRYSSRSTLGSWPLKCSLRDSKAVWLWLPTTARLAHDW